MPAGFGNTIEGVIGLAFFVFVIWTCFESGARFIQGTIAYNRSIFEIRFTSVLILIILVGIIIGSALFPCTYSDTVCTFLYFRP